MSVAAATLRVANPFEVKTHTEWAAVIRYLDWISGGSSSNLHCEVQFETRPYLELWVRGQVHLLDLNFP